MICRTKKERITVNSYKLIKNGIQSMNSICKKVNNSTTIKYSEKKKINSYYKRN